MRVLSRAVERFITIQHVLAVGGWAVVGFVAGRQVSARSGVAPTSWHDAASILMGLGVGAAAFVGFAMGLSLIGLAVRGVGRLVRRLDRNRR